MGKKRSVVCGLGTTLSQHWGQGIGGTRREQVWRQRPEAWQGRGRSKSAGLPVGVLLLVVSLGLCSFLPDAAADDDHDCMKAAHYIQWPRRSAATRSSASTRKVCAQSCACEVERPEMRTPSGFSNWDDPSQCATPGQCGPGDSAPPGQCEGPLDLRGFNPLSVVGRLDSAIAPRTGKVTFSGAGPWPAPLQRLAGLALYWWTRAGDTHDNRARARQLLTPEDPNLGAPQLGNCVDEPSDPAAGAIALFNIP